MAERLSVDLFLQERRDALKLSLVAGKAGLKTRSVEVPDIYRPGLVLSGYFRYYPPERIQIFGKTEIEYLDEMDPVLERKVLKQFFDGPLVCLIVTQVIKPSHPLVRWCNKKKVPLLRSELATTRLVAELTGYLEDRLAPRTTMHGTLVEVYGLGVLLLGKSGIGKSECALELVKRGHRLITDDLVKIRRSKGNFLVGWGDELIQHHMELRGLGIVDVRELFGVGAIRHDCQIQLLATLEEWQEGKMYERTGLDRKTKEILEVAVPHLEMPVQPGRSLAIVIEVAAMNERLRLTGVDPAARFNQRIIDAMAKRKPLVKAGRRGKARAGKKR